MSTTDIPIVYINLESRTDRRAHMEELLAQYGLEAERFNAIAYPGFGIWGCGQSHLAVLKLAQSRGWPCVWILEDDFEFLISPDEFRARMSAFISAYPSNTYDVFMAAYNMHEKEPFMDSDHNTDPDVCRVLFSQTASSYIVNAHYYQKLIDLYEEALPKLLETKSHWLYANDIVWRDFQRTDRWLAPVKRWGKQMDGYSDNAQHMVRQVF